MKTWFDHRQWGGGIKYKTAVSLLFFLFFFYVAESRFKRRNAALPNRHLVVERRVGPMLGGVLSDEVVRRAARCRYRPITTRARGWRSNKMPDWCQSHLHQFTVPNMFLLCSIIQCIPCFPPSAVWIDISKHFDFVFCCFCFFHMMYFGGRGS